MANIIEILMDMKGSEQVQKKIGGVTKSMKSATAAAAKYTAGIGVLVAGAVKLVEVHGVQARAEAQLEQALGKTSKALLNQASALQRQTRFGDEAIIQQQAFLASLNFSEDQIKSMIPAAIDLAEATGMDLASAVKNMSKTFSGMQGELGELIPQLKDLTKEEMQAGGAVELINELFGGQAKAAAEATAGIDQMKMTMGDLAELAGSKLAPALNKVGLAWSNILSGAPGKEWWEGVAIGMETASTEQGKLSMQVGGISRLVEEHGKLGAQLGDNGLKKIYSELGIEWDEHSTRQENLNYLTGMQEVLTRQLVQAKTEQKVALEEEAAAVADITKKYEALDSVVRKHGQDTIPFVIKKEGMFDKSLYDTSGIASDLTTDFQRFEQASKIAFQGAGAAAQAASDIIGATAGEDKRRQILAMRIAQLAAVINTAQGVTKALASSAPPINFINAAAVGAAGALQLAGIESAISQARSAATGLDEIFDRPTPIIVGDNREGEKVQISPAEDDSINTEGGIHIHFHGLVTQQTIRNEVMPVVRDAVRLGK